MAGETKPTTLARTELAEAIMDEFQVTKIHALDIIDTVLDEIVDALLQEGTVKISGLGKFSIRHKKERIGRNPKTGEPAIISNRKTISFRSSNVFKRAISKQ